MLACLYAKYNVFFETPMHIVLCLINEYLNELKTFAIVPTFVIHV